jgi:hypothetical protein
MTVSFLTRTVTSFALTIQKMPFSAFFGGISLVNVDSQQDTDNSNTAPVSSINVAKEGASGIEGGAGVAEEGTGGVEGGACVAEEGTGGIEGGAGVAPLGVLPTGLPVLSGGVANDGIVGVEEGTGVADGGTVAKDSAGVDEDEDSYDESVGCSSTQYYPKKSSPSSLQKDFPDVSVILYFC